MTMLAEREKKRTGDRDELRFPSIIVSPPTTTNHSLIRDSAHVVEDKRIYHNGQIYRTAFNGQIYRNGFLPAEFTRDLLKLSSNYLLDNEFSGIFYMDCFSE